MTKIKKLEIPYDEIRKLILEYFKTNPETQYLRVCCGIAEISIRKGIVPDPHAGSVVSGDTFCLTNDDEEIAREIIWNLIIERVITIGTNSANVEWPFLKLTKYGKDIVDSESPIPHDPSGYIGLLQSSVKDLDDITLSYIKESLSCYNIGSYMASLVMLGCASENIFKQLIESFIESFADKSKVRVKYEGKPLKRQYDEFSKSITSDIGLMPKETADNISTVLLGIFEIIRSNRNDFGHPTGKTINRDQLFAYLQVFIPYCKKVYEIILFYKGLSR